MKLNFWQLIGVLLLIAAVILIARRKTADAPVVPMRTPEPAVGLPATAPATVP